MDINKNLLEYGKLKIELKEINLKIKKIIELECIDLDEKEEKIQLFRYFESNKHREPMERFLDIEEWSEELEEEIKPISYELLELIKKRTVIKYKLGYKKMVITKYAIKLVKEEEVK